MNIATLQVRTTLINSRHKVQIDADDGATVIGLLTVEFGRLVKDEYTLDGQHYLATAQERKAACKCVGVIFPW